MKILKSVPGLDPIFKAHSVENAFCIEVDNLIFLSGFGGVDVKTGDMSDGPFEKHAHDSLDCFELVFKRMGLSLDHVVKVNCFLSNPVEDFELWNEIFKSRFKPPYPCRTTVGAPLVVGRVEIEVVAHRTSRLDALIVT